MIEDRNLSTAQDQILGSESFARWLISLVLALVLVPYR